MSEMLPSLRWPLRCIHMTDAAETGKPADALLELWCERWVGEDGEAVVALDGELCHYTAPQAVEALRWLAETVPSLALDLSGVTFMDTGGVTALDELQRLTAARGATLELRSPSPPVRWVLELIAPDGMRVASRTQMA